MLSPSITEIEQHLCRWFAQDMFGLPEGSGGEITSGGAMANFIALKTARDHRAGWDVRREGVAAGPPLGPLPVDRDPRRERPGGRHARHRRRERAAHPRRGLPDARRRPPRPDRRRSRGGAPAVRGGRHRGNGLDRRRGPARRARRRLRRGGALVPRRRGLRWPGGPRRGPAAARSRGSSAPTRSRSTRTSGSTRRTRAAACSSGTSTTSASRSTHTRATRCRTRTPPATGSTSGATGRCSAAAPGR